MYYEYLENILSMEKSDRIDDFYVIGNYENNKIFKTHLGFTILNSIVNLLFLIVIVIAVVILIRSPIVSTLNNDVPKISISIQNYLNVYIPDQIQKFNDLENKIDLLLNSTQLLIIKADMALDRVNNILNIPELNITITNILLSSSTVLEQIIDANITQMSQEFKTLVNNTSTLVNELNIIIQKIP